LRSAADFAEGFVAQVDLLLANELMLPANAPEPDTPGARTDRLMELMRNPDGVLLASPGFHGGPSGLIKNALDQVEGLRHDARPYLDGRAVRCIVCAAGWQACTTTLAALSSTVRALRGWPTPLGVTINSVTTAVTGHPVPPAPPRLKLRVGQVVGLRAAAEAGWRWS
jgi:FMN reductase